MEKTCTCGVPLTRGYLDSKIFAGAKLQITFIRGREEHPTAGRYVYGECIKTEGEMVIAHVTGSTWDDCLAGSIIRVKKDQVYFEEVIPQLKLDL